MGKHKKAVDLKVNFSRHYYSSFVLKPRARERFLLFCDRVCMCVICACVCRSVRVCVFGTLYGMQSHSARWLIMVSCLPSHFVTSLPFQSDNGHKCLSKTLYSSGDLSMEIWPTFKDKEEND